jgi:hypothetical protein
LLCCPGRTRTRNNLFIYLFTFETGAPWLPRLVSNSRSCCLRLPGAGLTARAPLARPGTLRGAGPGQRRPAAGTGNGHSQHGRPDSAHIPRGAPETYRTPQHNPSLSNRPPRGSRPLGTGVRSAHLGLPLPPPAPKPCTGDRAPRAPSTVPQEKVKHFAFPKLWHTLHGFVIICCAFGSK